MLTLRGVNTYYGTRHMLKDVSIEVGEAEIVCVIGANGSGKTTVVRTISGLVKVASGEMTYNGEPLNGLAPPEIVKRGVVQIPEGRQLFPLMSVEENLMLGAYLRRDKRSKRDDLQHVYELFPVLKEKRKQNGADLSGGQQQMVAIGRALMSSPKLLMMDEPSLGLSPLVVESVAQTITEIRSRGVSVLLNEQNANMALGLSDRGYVLELGEITVSGTGQELLNNDSVRRAYLGL